MRRRPVGLEPEGPKWILFAPAKISNSAVRLRARTHTRTHTRAMGKRGKSSKSGNKQDERMRLASYISKKHKALQRADESDGAVVRTISSGAVAAIESMSEHLLQVVITNARSVNSYTRTQSFGASSAKAATMLTLPGKLKRSACAAGSDAVAKYKASSAAAKAASAPAN